MSGGLRVCFVTSPEDAATVHRNPTVFTHHTFLKDIVASMGLSHKASRVLWDGTTAPNPNIPVATPVHARTHTPPQENNTKSFASYLLTSLRQELAPSNSPNNLQNAVLEAVLKFTQWDRILPKWIISENAKNRIQISLTSWTRYSLGIGATEALFGQSLLQIAPNFLDCLFEYDDKSWMLICQIPWPWSRKMYENVRDLQSILTRYFSLPADQRSDASFLIINLEKDMRNAGIESRDIALFVLLIFWG